jgi:hypothetical protein
VFKISTIDSSGQYRLVLEGKLIAPWTKELRSECAQARADLHGRELVVEIRNLTTISQEGENVLLELMSEGVKFRCRGVFTRQVLRQLARRNAQMIGSPPDEVPAEK